MKLTIALSLLVCAYATVVLAIPAPDVLAGSDTLRTDSTQDTGPSELTYEEVNGDNSVVDKRAMMYGPKKMILGLNGAKRANSEDNEVDSEDIEKRAMMYGPKKMILGLNGAKRENGEDAQLHTEVEADNVEKRAIMYGPKKMILGLNGA